MLMRQEELEANNSAVETIHRINRLPKIT